MPSKIKNSRTLKGLFQVKALLPKGESFHDQKGAIIWISKKHILKIEEQLQLFEKMKITNIRAIRAFMKKKQIKPV